MGLSMPRSLIERVHFSCRRSKSHTTRERTRLGEWQAVTFGQMFGSKVSIVNTTQEPTNRLPDITLVPIGVECAYRPYRAIFWQPMLRYIHGNER